MNIQNTTLAGTGVISISVLSNVLLWFCLKYFSQDNALTQLQPSTYLVLQFGITWTILMTLTVIALFAGNNTFASKNRMNFLLDCKKLSLKHFCLILISSLVAILSFYAVMNWFALPQTKISAFVPLRTAIAICILVALGVLIFKEKNNVFIWSGIGLLILAIIMIFVGRFMINV